ALGVRALWSHQAEAIDLARAGRSVVLATGTASGKSLVYQAAIAEAVASRPAPLPPLGGLFADFPELDPAYDPRARAAPPPGTALCIFPTKALAQDQLRAINALQARGLVAMTYDGDTPSELRQWARRHANVVLTNPEMLHTAMLPFHGRWATFLRRLRYVVVDE